MEKAPEQPQTASQVAVEYGDALEAEMSSLDLGGGEAAAAVPTARSDFATSADRSSSVGRSSLDIQGVREAAARYQNGSLDLASLINHLTGGPRKMCDWGSSQYASVLAMFRTLCALKTAGLDPTAVIGWGPSVEAIPAPISLAEALAKIAAGLAALIQEDAENRGEVPELATVELLATASCLDPAFEAMKNQAWDLWTALAHTSQLVFGTDFTAVEDGRSQRAQRELASTAAAALPRTSLSADGLAPFASYATALQGYALVEAGYVRDPNEAFSGFDA